MVELDAHSQPAHLGRVVDYGVHFERAMTSAWSPKQFLSTNLKYMGSPIWQEWSGEENNGISIVHDENQQFLRDNSRTCQLLQSVLMVGVTKDQFSK